MLSERQIANVRRHLREYPIELEEKIFTLERPLIIESACPGRQPKEWGPPDLYPVKPPGYQDGGIRYGAIPVSIDDQVKEDVAAIKAFDP